MNKKVKKIIQKIKKYFQNKTKNIRFETRYKNSQKKITEEIDVLKKQLEEDENLKKIEQLKTQIKRLKNNINNLKKEIIVYDCKLRGLSPKEIEEEEKMREK